MLAIVFNVTLQNTTSGEAHFDTVLAPRFRVNPVSIGRSVPSSVGSLLSPTLGQGMPEFEDRLHVSAPPTEFLHTFLDLQSPAMTK